MVPGRWRDVVGDSCIHGGGGTQFAPCNLAADIGGCVDSCFEVSKIPLGVRGGTKTKRSRYRGVPYQ